MHHVVLVCRKVCQYEEIRKEIATHQVTVTQAKWLRVWTLHTASHPSGIVNCRQPLGRHWRLDLSFCVAGSRLNLAPSEGHAMYIQISVEHSQIYTEARPLPCQMKQDECWNLKFCKKEQKKKPTARSTHVTITTETLRYKEIRFRTCSYTLLLALSNRILRTKGGYKTHQEL